MSKEEKLSVVRVFAPKYKGARKKGKSEILTQVSELTGYSRKHLMEILVKVSRKIKIKRVRFSRYLKVLDKLKELWAVSNYATGQRLVPGIPTYLDSLERHRELVVTDEQKKLLLQISSATVDRLLKTERRKVTLKGRSGTKPGTLLKHQIPIKMWTDWDNTVPGFLEIDTVHHNGGSPAGEYIHTLDTTDVATGWNQCRALMGRSERYTVKALDEIRQRLPFPMLGIDFDSGGEFVNWHLIKYCQGNKISYTRSREGIKNDQNYIEQQNYSVVRRFAGYIRLDTWKQLKLLNMLYEFVSDYQNFFQPIMRLKEKLRDGAHVTRRYTVAKTAYQRTLEYAEIDLKVKEKLKERYLTLNPKSLIREITRLGKKLNS